MSANKPEAENPEINISVTFRHTESTPALMNYASEKLTHAVKKFVNGEADVQVVLSVEKRDQTAEVKLKTKDYDVEAKAVTEDLYSAIDKVVDTIETQVRKQKDRLRSHKHVSGKEADFPS